MTIEDFREELEELVVRAKGDLSPDVLLEALEEQCAVMRGLKMQAGRDQNPPATA